VPVGAPALVGPLGIGVAVATPGLDLGVLAGAGVAFVGAGRAGAAGAGVAGAPGAGLLAPTPEDPPDESGGFVPDPGFGGGGYPPGHCHAADEGASESTAAPRRDARIH